MENYGISLLEFANLGPDFVYPSSILMSQSKRWRGSRLKRGYTVDYVHVGSANTCSGNPNNDFTRFCGRGLFYVLD